jgi:FkbM family methyltransferase
MNAADFAHILQAAARRDVTVAGMSIHLPWHLQYRVSVVAGNIHVHRLIDREVSAGSVVVDVGAHVGYNALYAAARVGRGGRVYAVEPAPDNVEVLLRNIGSNHVSNVAVIGCAAGGTHGTRDLYLRGAASAVNSLFPSSIYAQVTGAVPVTVAPVDDLVAETNVRLVKIDVEGAELDALAGMSRIISTPGIRLIVEWHPALQQAAGHSPEALPEFLLARGFTLHVWRGGRIVPVAGSEIGSLSVAMLHRRRPLDLLARRSSGLGASMKVH